MNVKFVIITHKSKKYERNSRVRGPRLYKTTTINVELSFLTLEGPFQRNISQYFKKLVNLLRRNYMTLFA